LVRKKFILFQYTIEQIQPQPDGTPSKIKVKVRLNRNGIFDVTQAALIETIEEPNAPAGKILESRISASSSFLEEAMETAAPATQTTENGGDQSIPTATEPMEDVSSFYFSTYNHHF
jgi:molecular chaperone DnaK (HSP70)